MVQIFDDITLRNLSDIISDILTHRQNTEQLLSAKIQK